MKGLGKTVTTLTAIKELKYNRFLVRKILVIAPKKVAEGTWTREKDKWEHTKMLRVSQILGSQAKRIQQSAEPAERAAAPSVKSQLSQWPVQIKLVPVRAPYFDGAHLLIAADCTAYAYGNFHQEFIRNRITLIGCPKLDEGDYSQKLTEILSQNAIKSVTIVRMEVPCCGGIEKAAVTAMKNSGKFIPWNVVVISADGKVVER